MAAETLNKLTDAVIDRWSSLSKKEQTLVIAGASAATASIGIGILYNRVARSDYKAKPSTFDLSGGSIERNAVKEAFQDYAGSFGTDSVGIIDRQKTVHLVDVFYSLVTDIYEWGWGQSFHFSPKLPGKDWKASEAAHEARIAVSLGLKPGTKCLDVGCGVGGPMRTIAAVSGAHVTGITINEYQVKRALYHNEKQGLAPLTDVVQGNFLKMPFAEASFDAAYAIEATCHADKLEEVYAEIHRILKPGGLFASYEWVSTDKFDPEDQSHVKIIDGIVFGNGLPEMRTRKQAEEAGEKVGFELVLSIDIATASIVAGPWWDRLKLNAWQHQLDDVLVRIFETIKIAPKGITDVHEMLVTVAKTLVRGGETGVFTPMQLLLFKKN